MLVLKKYVILCIDSHATVTVPILKFLSYYLPPMTHSKSQVWMHHGILKGLYVRGK